MSSQGARPAAERHLQPARMVVNRVLVPALREPLGLSETLAQTVEDLTRTVEHLAKSLIERRPQRSRQVEAGRGEAIGQGFTGQFHALVRRTGNGKATNEIVADQDIDIRVVVAIEVEIPTPRAGQRRLDTSEPGRVEAQFGGAYQRHIVRDVALHAAPCEVAVARHTQRESGGDLDVAGRPSDSGRAFA